MATEIKAPKYPKEISSGELVEIHVKEGEFAADGEHIFSIETDKAILEVEATADGKVVGYNVMPGGAVSSEQVVAIFEECEIPKNHQVLKSTYDPKATRLEPNMGIMGETGLLFKIGGVGFLIGFMVGALSVFFSLNK